MPISDCVGRNARRRSTRRTCVGNEYGTLCGCHFRRPRSEGDQICHDAGKNAAPISALIAAPALIAALVAERARGARAALGSMTWRRSSTETRGDVLHTNVLHTPCQVVSASVPFHRCGTPAIANPRMTVRGRSGPRASPVRTSDTSSVLMTDPSLVHPRRGEPTTETRCVPHSPRASAESSTVRSTSSRGGRRAVPHDQPGRGW